MPTYGGLYAWELEKRGKELRVRVDGQLTFTRMSQIINAALDGIGLGYVPEDAAKPLIAKGKAVHVLQDWCDPFPG